MDPARRAIKRHPDRDRLALKSHERLATKAFTARVLIESGMFAPDRPDRIARSMRAIRRWGPTIAAGCIVSAIRHPEQPALVDERGSLTFEELDSRTNALADALHAAGLGEGARVAIMCRNHRGFVETTIACSKLGADALFVSTELTAPQLAEVCAREQPAAIVCDEEFAGLAGEVSGERPLLLAWTEQGSSGRALRTLEQLIAQGDRGERLPPARMGRHIILTSGTTGAPKGAIRRQPRTLDPVAGLLATIPLHARERTLIAAPLFHAWGFAHLLIASALSSTLVLRRRFDPQDALRAIDDHGVTALIVVPVMLQRMLELGTRVSGLHDTGSLRVIATSGSVLPGELATRVMDAFGDILYNLYGSTEVAWATIAAPADLRAAPGTAGRPPRGTVVRLYDADGHEVAAGRSGRIFVGSELVFDGYSGGGGKLSLDGLLATGDVGHLDEDGRLFVDGRDDEMIVSGAENVFPREVEDAIARLNGVGEVAVVAVADERFAHRLRAFVVRSAGSQIDEGDVTDHVRRQLERFKVPRDVVFVDELPRNAAGKVLKRELVLRTL